MEWLNSQAFWWLTTLAIPVMIHLLSKKRQQVTKIGSTMFIVPSETMSSKSIHFTQWLLFIIRCLLIISLIFILAKLKLNSESDRKAIYVEDSVLPLIENNDKYNRLISTNGDGLVFSISGNQRGPYDFINYWSFIHYLNSQNAEAVVYSANTLNGFRGSSESLDTAIEWVSVPIEDEIVSNDTIYGNTGAIPVEFTISERLLKHKIFDSFPNGKSDTTFINIRASINSEDKLASFYKMIQAINGYLPWEIAVTDNYVYDWIINIDTSTYMEGPCILNYQSTNTSLNFYKMFDQNYKLSGHIDLKNLVISDILDQWTSEIIINHMNFDQYDKLRINSLPKFQRGNNKEKVKTYATGGNIISLPFWIIFFFLIILERIISHKSKA